METTKEKILEKMKITKLELNPQDAFNKMSVFRKEKISFGKVKNFIKFLYLFLFYLDYIFRR